MLKPLNLLALLLGLALAFLPFRSFAYKSYCVTPRQGGWVLTDLTVGVVYPDATATYGYDYSNGVLIYASGGETHFDVDSACVGYSWCTSCADQTDNPSAIIVGSIYPPEPPEPSLCSDGLLSDGEIGIDCGGSCNDSCDSSICENQSATLSDGLCSEHTSPDAFGNCPSGTTLIYTDNANVCATSPVPAIQYFSGDLQDPSGDVVDDGFFAGVEFPLSGVDDPFESGQVSFIQDPEIVVDNGDGTETATVNKYIKRLNPKTGEWETVSTGSASVSRVVNSPSGTGFVSGSSGVGIAPGFSGETEDEIPIEATPLIAAPDGLDFGDKLTDLLNSSSAEFESYVDDVQGSDLVQHFTDIFTIPDDPGDSPLTISMGAYGVHLIDSQMMDTTLSLVGQVLVVCAFIAGAYIVFRKQ